MLFADVIIDISHENLDRTYQYRIPDELVSEAVIGAPVEIPFGAGNRSVKGYLIGLSREPKIDINRIKPLKAIEKNGLVMESRMIALAARMKEMFGGTMNDALRTVMPVKRSVKPLNNRTVQLAMERDAVQELYEQAVKKHYTAKQRLLNELLTEGSADYELLVKKLNISRKAIADMETAGVIRIETERKYRNPFSFDSNQTKTVVLNEEQEKAVRTITEEYRNGIRKTYLLHGVTDSGKTEVYLNVIEEVIRSGKQVIMLIPEIALTYQTVKRFRKRFGERVSFLHSRLSDGEKFDQYNLAEQGGIDVIIGPRSALFTPLPDVGLIVIDEEHESSYKSEQVPKYHARELVLEYAKMVGASVLLGSATPSTESYYRAEKGEFTLLQLKHRPKEAVLPTVHIVDMREELKEHHTSIFSRRLLALMEDRLRKKEQIMIFINRRGYAGFISCRSCGEVIQCPHCSVSMTLHGKDSLVCHYCGYEQPLPKLCPKCNSKYIGKFGTGTEKVEELLKKTFPTARVLRMDADTTKNKNGHEQILSAFANEEADILVGTQMIVKGHDFQRVTLMGIIAADLSLQASDYRAGERTFQLLAQAAGRAGRAEYPGEVVIQTYNPEHYAVTAAAKEDYAAFYENEIMYRSLMNYPPAANLMAVVLSSKEEEEADASADFLATRIKAWLDENDGSELAVVIGPAPAGIAKIKDVYRRVIYLKHGEYGLITACKDAMEKAVTADPVFAKCTVQFDINPLSGQ